VFTAGTQTSLLSTIFNCLDTFSSHDKRDLEEVSVKILVTKKRSIRSLRRDGRMDETCQRAKSWKGTDSEPHQPYRSQEFKAVNTARPQTADPFEFQSVEMDDEGHIAIERSPFAYRASGEFTQLDVPSLLPGAKCTYD